MSHVMVCVTGQKTCERLIVAGRAIADEAGLGLSVVHVARQGADFLGNPSEAEAIEYLYQASAAHNADMTLVHSDDVLGTLAARAKKIGATVVVLGMSTGRGDRDFARDLEALLPEATLRVIYT